MPAYDYRCETCGRVFEQRHSIHAIPNRVACQKVDCGGQANRAECQGGTLVDTKECSSKYPYVSDRLPRHAEGCMTTSDGKPVIMSRMHEDRVLKTLGYERE